MEMKPLTKVNPSEEMTPQREAYDKAFALACRYSRGRDLVEEMVASNYWPLGKSRPSFKIEMVNVPIYGPAEVLSPDLGLSCRRVKARKTFVSSMEEGAREIINDIFDREFLVQRAVGGTMPRLNRVFEGASEGAEICRREGKEDCC